VRNEYDLMPGSWRAGYESEQSEAWLSDIFLMHAARRVLPLGNHLCIHALEARGFCFVPLIGTLEKDMEEKGIIRSA
jgi:hypothetical protein